MSSHVVKFHIGQTVYSKIKEDIRGMVTGIVYRHTHIVYLVTWDSDLKEDWISELELSEEKIIKT